ncbi:condensation domain-containing protein [Funiculus sociatus GB2-A5]|uniref:Condensation domain-containing protein n=2 Tax=Funiculus TaxID=2886342 RepID=A0ABV0JJ73_9CYAN|nr:MULTISPECIES: condensation domain-containing protein [unclassified Trichocoleus]
MKVDFSSDVNTSEEDVFVFPASFAQQRLWFFDRLEPGSLQYISPVAIQLTGALDVPALEESLNEIVRRHEALRTTFVMVDGQPVQVIAPSLRWKLPVVFVRSLCDRDRDVQVQNAIAQETQQPFDLSQGPLLRTKLLQLDEEQHVLLLTIHHIISDGWSKGVLVREVAALYEAFSQGRPSPLPELPIQYADYAIWQRQRLQGQVLEAQMSYWKQQLSGNLSVLELPSDRPRPTVQTGQGATQSFGLPTNLSEQLKTLSQRENVTLFMTMLAAFKTLLYRYTRQDDILTGSSIANRNRAEFEGLIGFFVNTLVMRTDLSGNPSFRELLHRVRKVALEAYDHQDLPFEQLVETLQPTRNLSYHPLFQVWFSLNNAPMPALQLSGLSVSLLEVKSNTAQFDLSFDMMETPQGLIGTVEYSTDLFVPATISRMLGHFQTLLEGIVANPNQRLSDLPLLTKSEQHITFMLEKEATFNFDFALTL